MEKELSTVQWCRKNGWHKGDKIKAGYPWGDTYPRTRYFQITGIGRHEVLALEFNLPPFTTTGETMLPYSDPKYFNWRRCTKKECLSLS
jgi:hypothetical protein